jgi:hypothetical protein
MGAGIVARRTEALLGTLATFISFLNDSPWAQRRTDPGIADFVLGNPHDMPLEAFGESLRRWSVPQDKDWFAYTLSKPVAQEARRLWRPGCWRGAACASPPTTSS